MPVLSRILGWTPPDNEDYLDVALSSNPLLPLQNPTFHISEPNPIRRAPPRRVVSRAHFQSNSPASSNSALSSSDGENDHEHDPEQESSSNSKRVDGHGKHVDPSWVARPRNEFILFRCDYVRKHSREGKRVRRAPGAEAEKTLSKQAAEAWHHLPPEERLYWKDRANGERNEHARRYPDYRYRPKKSAAGRKRQMTSPSKTQPVVNANASASITPAGNVGETTTVGRPTDSAGVPLKSTSPTVASDAASVAGGSKTRPRRSCSVPELKGNTEPVNRRLRSTASHGWLAASSNVYNPTHTTCLSSEFAGSGEYSGSNTSQPSSGNTRLMLHPSSTASSSSSLLNWNGQRMVAATPQPTQFLSSTAVSFSGSGGSGMDITGPLLTEFTTGGNPIAPSQAFNNSDNSTHSLSLSHTSSPHPFSASSSTQHAHHPHYTAEGDIWLPQLHPTTHGYPGDDIDIDIDTDLAGSHSPSGAVSVGGGAGTGPVTGAGAVAAAVGGGPSIFDPSPVGALGHLSHLGSNLVDYGAGTACTTGVQPSSSPETLFTMDTEELFANLNY